MSKAPERITAWLSKDGSTRFEGGRLFPAGVEVEYVRADRIEELEAERDDYANKLMQANDTYTEMHLEIELLKAKLAEYQMVASAIDNQWADGEDENADLKLKLAKAVKCLQSLIIEYDKVDLAYDEPKSMTAVYGVALDTLAELTGGKDE